MKKVAKFEKVSFKEFKKSLNNIGLLTDEDLEDIYNSIELPKRSTKGSAGYDFVSPGRINLNPGESIIIPTGIRCKIEEGWFLSIYPRSGLGFKTHVHLANTVGIIDSDYYNADNEGHIMVKLVMDDQHELSIPTGAKFCQGIFTEFGITEDDEAEGERVGGFGSTN